MIRSLPLVAMLLAACAAQPAPSQTSVTVFAAASLRDTFEDLAAAYTDEHAVAVVLSFDASSALRAQIEEGAPADVFASADLVNAQALVDAEHTDGPARIFAANALTVVVPGDNPTGIDRWSTLARPGIRIIAAGEEVPITRYAQELVENLAAHPDAPDGFAAGYAANIVSREDNARAILAKIEVGEGDAAVVYETDARSSANVGTIGVPEDANVEAEYAVVAFAGADSGGEQFATWLLSDEAQAILADHGFRPPR